MKTILSSESNFKPLRIPSSTIQDSSFQTYTRHKVYTEGSGNHVDWCGFHSISSMNGKHSSGNTAKWARGPASNLLLCPLKITSVNRNIWKTNSPADCCTQILACCPSGKEILEKWNDTTGPCFSISLHQTHFCTFANQYTQKVSP